ncbi:alpha/beta hydrolase family protein, partial [Escherichia coli]|uniref:alpha/beta hydrolase family protein n=1 Tax=Escherichia coli TaxID=562 RepID=UPI001FCE0E64
MKITDHKLSEGIALTFRVPEGNIKHPLIILCHGFCGIRNVLLPCFANAFTEAGFATITFDYRGFGESDGERGRLVPAMQTEDIISVINWAEKQECIDNQRIIITTSEPTNLLYISYASFSWKHKLHTTVY